MAILEITGDDYHVLKYPDIRYYLDNAFWLFFHANFYKASTYMSCVLTQVINFR